MEMVVKMGQAKLPTHAVHLRASTSGQDTVTAGHSGALLQ